MNNRVIRKSPYLVRPGKPTTGSAPPPHTTHPIVLGPSAPTCCGPKDLGSFPAHYRCASTGIRGYKGGQMLGMGKGMGKEMGGVYKWW